MSPTRVLLEIRQMRFADVYEGWRVGRLTQGERRKRWVSDRSFRRFSRRFEHEGLEGLIDRRMGQVSARRAAVDEAMVLTELYRALCRLDREALLGGRKTVRKCKKRIFSNSGGGAPCAEVKYAKGTRPPAPPRCYRVCSLMWRTAYWVSGGYARSHANYQRSQPTEPLGSKLDLEGCITLRSFVTIPFPWALLVLQR